MRTRFIFHIGLHKTGTTAIQRYCAMHAHELAKQGIDFPVLAQGETGPKRHRFLADWFRGRRNLVPAELASGFDARLSRADACLISAEGLYLTRGRARIRALSEAFGPRPSAICYLREPVSHMVSLYKQALGKNEKQNFASYAEMHRRNLPGSSSFGYYAFDRNLRKWSEAFDLQVRSYVATDCLRDFCACIGLSLPDSGAQDAARMNVSFGDEIAALHFALNRGLDQGILAQAEWLDLKRLLKESRPVSLPVEIMPRLHMATIDMRPFLGDFRAANPAYAWSADTSPDDVSCFDGEILDVGSIVNDLREYLPAARHS